MQRKVRILALAAVLAALLGFGWPQLFSNSTAIGHNHHTVLASDGTAIGMGNYGARVIGWGEMSSLDC